MIDLETKVGEYLDKIGDYASPTKSSTSGVTEQQWLLIRLAFIQILYSDSDAYLHLFRRFMLQHNHLYRAITKNLERMQQLVSTLHVEGSTYTSKELSSVSSAMSNMAKMLHFRSESSRRQDALAGVLRKTVGKHLTPLKQSSDGTTREESIQELRDLFEDTQDLYLRSYSDNVWLTLRSPLIRSSWKQIVESKTALMLNELQLQVASTEFSDTDITVGLVALLQQSTALSSNTDKDAIDIKNSSRWEATTPIIPASVTAGNSPPYVWTDGSVSVDVDGSSVTMELPEATCPRIPLRNPSPEAPYSALPAHQAQLVSEPFPTGVSLVRKAIAYRPCQPTITPTATMVSIDATTASCTIANDATFFDVVEDGDLMILDRAVYNVYAPPPDQIIGPAGTAVWEVWRIVRVLSSTTAIMEPPVGAAMGAGINIGAVLINDRISIVVDGQPAQLDLSSQWPTLIASIRPAWPSTVVPPLLYGNDWLNLSGLGLFYPTVWLNGLWEIPKATLVAAYNAAFVHGDPFAVDGGTITLTSPSADEGGSVAVSEALSDADRPAVTPMQSRLKLWHRAPAGAYRIILDSVIGEFTKGEDVILAVGGTREVYSFLPGVNELLVFNPGVTPSGTATGTVSGATGTIVGTGFLPYDAGTAATDTINLSVMHSGTHTLYGVNQAISTGRYTSPTNLKNEINNAFAFAGANTAISATLEGDQLVLVGDTYGSKAWIQIGNGSWNTEMQLSSDVIAHGSDVTAEQVSARVTADSPLVTLVDSAPLVTHGLAQVSGTAFGLLDENAGISGLAAARILLTPASALSFGSVTGSFAVGEKITNGSGASAVIDRLYDAAMEISAVVGTWAASDTITAAGGATATVTAAPGSPAGAAAYTIATWSAPAGTLEQYVPLGMYWATIHSDRLIFRSEDTTVSSAIHFSACDVVTALALTTSEQRGTTYHVTCPEQDLATVLSPPVRVNDWFSEDVLSAEMENVTVPQIEQVITDDDTLRLDTELPNDYQADNHIYPMGRGIVSQLLRDNEDRLLQISAVAKSDLSGLSDSIEQAYTNHGAVLPLQNMLSELLTAFSFSIPKDEMPNENPMISALLDELESRQLRTALEKLTTVDIEGFLRLTAAQTTDWGLVESALNDVRLQLPRLSQDDVETIMNTHDYEPTVEEEIESSHDGPPALVIDEDEDGEPWIYG